MKNIQQTQKITEAKCSQFPVAHSLSARVSFKGKEPNCREAATRCHCKSKIIPAVSVKSLPGNLLNDRPVRLKLPYKGN